VTASELPPDFRWIPGWMDIDEARALFDALLAGTPWEDPVLRVVGRSIPMPRRVAFYGPHPYAYSGLLHAPRPLTPVLEDVRLRIERTARHPFNTLLMNLYRTGADSVSWHSDDDYPHGGNPAVASLSLGATRRFRIAGKRGRDDRHAVELTSGGLLVMAGRSQEEYRHALPKTASPVGPRINLTFRYMAESNVIR
jgi:alkylated DNA repair dioxygenase AlkB